MATSNFSRGNRTIFVSNEDLEFQNHPCFERSYNSSDNIVEITDGNFIFHEVYFEYGYYEGAKIDYREIDTEDVIDKYFNIYGYADVEELSDDCKITLFEYLTDEQIDEVCNQWADYESQGYEFDTFCEITIEKLIDTAKKIEGFRVNNSLDKLVEEYGYEEFRRIGSASNGETFYEKI